MPASPAHDPRHDPALIAAAVDDTLTPAERAMVDGWLATCAACRGLRDDLAAIATANRQLPTPPRPRDFRITPGDPRAARRATWRELLDWIGSGRDKVTRPLATGLTTLGLVGVLVGAGGGLIGSPSVGENKALAPVSGAAGAEATSDVTGAKGSPQAVSGSGQPGAAFGSDTVASQLAGPVGSATVDIAGESGAPPAGQSAPPIPSGSQIVTQASAPDQPAVGASGASSGGGTVTAVPPGVARDNGFGSNGAPGSSGPNGLLVGSLVVLIVGLALFVLRRTGRSTRLV